MIDLSGSRVLVLGGSGVLGSAIAERLATAGSSVLLAGRDAERLAAVAAATGSQSIEVDLRSAEAPDMLVSTALEKLGGLDGVVNAAGVVAFGPLAAASDAAIDDLMAVDLVAPLRVFRQALSVMDGGFIVNITGVVVDQPPAGMAVYAAAKAGLSAASKALARELRRQGTHVLDARPPHTETGLANRPIEGSAPPLPEGLDPEAVADRIVAGLIEGKRELTAADFA